MRAKEFGQAVRGHWGLKTNCIGNWMYHTKRTSAVSVRDMQMPTWPSLGGSPYNMLKANKTEKLGIKTKRLLAGWDMDYCEVVLAG